MAFRQTMGRVHREFAQKGDWFFNTWNADRSHGRQEPARRSPSRTRPRAAGHRPDCWVLHPGEPGTASATSKTATACSTRSRCRSSRRAWPTRAASTSAAFRPRSSPPTCTARRRGREDHRLHDPVPVLDRHHQGQVGHAAQRAARLQARLRHQRAAGGGAADLT